MSGLVVSPPLRGEIQDEEGLSMTWPREMAGLVGEVGCGGQLIAQIFEV